MWNETEQTIEECLESLVKLLTMPRKLLKFLILFDNSSLLYFPGQFLSGRVLLELQENTPVLGIVAYF